MPTTLKVIRVKLSPQEETKLETIICCCLQPALLGWTENKEDEHMVLGAFCTLFKHQILRSPRERERLIPDTHFGKNENVRGWIQAIKNGLVTPGTYTKAVSLPWKMTSRAILGYSEAKQPVKTEPPVVKPENIVSVYGGHSFISSLCSSSCSCRHTSTHHAHAGRLCSPAFRHHQRFPLNYPSSAAPPKGSKMC